MLLCQMANPIDFTVIAEQDFGEPVLNALHLDVRIADGTWRAAKRSGAQGDLLRDLVQDYVNASYAFQKARYGKIKVRMSVSALLRLSV